MGDVLKCGHMYNDDCDDFETNVLCFDEIDGLIEDVPELWELSKARLATAQREMLWPFKTAGYPFANGFNSLHSEWGRTGFRLGLEQHAWNGVNQTIEEDLKDPDDEYFGQHIGREVNIYEDWVGIKHVLAAAQRCNDSSRQVELRLHDISMAHLSMDDGQRGLSSHEKLTMLIRAFGSPNLTSFDLTFDYGRKVSPAKWISMVGFAANHLKSVRIAWSYAEDNVYEGVAHHFFSQCTFPQLENLTVERLHWWNPIQTWNDPSYLAEGYDPGTVVPFLLRHGPTLRSLRFRNILVNSDITTDDYVGFVGDESVTELIPALEPLRSCFAAINLRSAKVLVDIFEGMSDIEVDLGTLKDDIERVVEMLAMERVEAEETFPDVVKTYDFAEWLLEETERRGPKGVNDNSE